MRLSQTNHEAPVVVEGLLPAFSATLIAAILYAWLPPKIALVQPWILLAIMPFFLVAVALLRKRGKRRIAHHLGHISTAVMTCFIAYSLIFLVVGIFRGAVAASVMLRASGILWVMNIIVFAPVMASIKAWMTTSASEWPTGPLPWGIGTLASTSGRPDSNL